LYTSRQDHRLESSFMSIATALIRQFETWIGSAGSRPVVKQAEEALAPEMAKLEKMASDRLSLSSKAPARLGIVSAPAKQSVGEQWLARRRVAMNRINGDRRELIVKRFLEKKYPQAEGYTVHPEQYLRDKSGEIAHDVKTGEARRLDFVVFKGDRPHATIEVTSKQASKTAQTAKELKIREAGGRYLINPGTGKLVKLRPDQRTAVLRLH
jgi:hypothetical protein